MLVSLLFIASRHVPGGESFICWRNSSIESIILLSVFRALLLHSLNSVELVLERRALGDGPWLLSTEECRGASGTRNRTTSNKG